MEYVVFCDKANKAYEVQRGSVCPACGKASDDNVSHVVMGVPLGTDRHTRRYLFRSFLRRCKEIRESDEVAGFIVM